MPPPGTESLVEAALLIARGLVACAEHSGDGCTWQSDVVVGIDDDDPVIGHGDVGITLYDGTAGIAFALATCVTAAPPGESDLFADVARGAARYALTGAPDLLEAGRLGLFDGATGVALGAVTTGRLCGDAAVLEGGIALTHEVAAWLEARCDDADLDLIGGLAGTILGLQRIAQTANEVPTVRPLHVAANRLIATAEPQTWGAAWPPAPGGMPLLGLGHGCAGISLALAEMAAATGDPDAWRACADGLEYERGWFDSDRVAWPDLREHNGTDDPSSWMAAWCHGAIGIGLSRLRLTRLTQDAVVLAEATAALQAARDLVVSAGTALHSGQTSDCSACHGLAGVVELLLVAGQALGDAHHARAARRVAALLLEERAAAEGAWPCGLPGAGEIPALMIGTAGVALTLLRAAGAVTVPTPLLPGPAAW